MWQKLRWLWHALCRHDIVKVVDTGDTVFGYCSCGGSVRLQRPEKSLSTLAPWPGCIHDEGEWVASVAETTCPGVLAKMRRLQRDRAKGLPAARLVPVDARHRSK